MLTKINEAAFKLLLAVVFVVFLSGCKPPGPKALLDGKRLLERGKVAAAVDRLETATRLLGGTNAAAWNYLGLAYHQSGQASNAVVAYQRALAANPDLVEARFNLGSLWFESGRPSEAKSEFTAYTLRRPTSAVGFQRLALAEMHLREATLAEQHIRKALELDASAPESWNTLGLIQLQRGRVRDAAQSFGGALQKQRNFAPAMINLAVVCQQQLGDRATALKLYRQYLQLKPQPADAAAVAAVVRQLEMELAPARPAAAAAPEPAPPAAPVTPVASAPQQAAKPEVVSPPPVPQPTAPAPVVAPAPAPVSPAPRPKPTGAEVQTVKRAPVAVRMPVEPEIKVAPVVDVAAPVAQAAASPARASSSAASEPEVALAADEKRGFFKKVNPANLFRGDSKKPTVTPLPSAEEATSIEPDVTSTSVPASNGARYQYKGAGNVAPGNRAEAQRLATQGIKAMEVRRYVDAATAFRSAAKADPSWFQAHFNLAVAAMEAGYNSEALAASETALALEPNSAEARYNFALALKRGGYFTDAAIQLEKLLSAHPDEVRGHLALGNLYAEPLRQRDKARTHYQKLLELDPRHPRAGAIHFWLAANPGR